MTTVTGILRDAQQNAIPNAGVTVRYTRALVGFDGGAVAQNDRLFTTDGSGLLTMTDLVPGHYDVSVFMPINANTTGTVIRRGTGTVPTGEATLSWEAFLQEPIGQVDSTVLQQAIEAKDDAEAAAATAVAAAAGVEFPVSYAPQTLDAGQQEQARENIGAASIDDVMAAVVYDNSESGLLADTVQSAIDETAQRQERAARIKFIPTANYNYDRIVITGGPGALEKRQGPAGDFSESLTLREAARLTEEDVLISCDTNGHAQTGFQIIDGVAIRDWDDQSETLEQILMHRDGTLIAARFSDGLTAQDYVEQGFVWSAGHRNLLVENGLANTLSADAFWQDVSARNVIGQRANGDIVFLMVEGQSGSYGVNGSDLQALCLSEGLQVAMNLDGGGSSQAWWKTAYSHPSGQSSRQERPRRTWLVPRVSRIQDFDTGAIPIPLASGVSADADEPGIYVRQINAWVYVGISVSGTFPQGTATPITEDFPWRFRPERGSYMRGALSTGGGRGMVGTTGSAAASTPIFSVVAQDANETSAVGSINYQAKWSR